MKKLFVLSACLLAGTWAFAQTEGTEETPETETTVEASAHGQSISELAKTTENGREKGSIISSAARQKALMHANVKAKFNREGVPANAENASGNKPGELPVVSGKPTTLPPVSPPTTGKPSATPVGKPAGVPVGSKPTGVPGGN